MTDAPPCHLALLEGSTVTPLVPGQVLRRRGTDGLWRRLALCRGAVGVTHGTGARAHRERVEVGGVVRLGRRAALIVALCPSTRCPGAIRWRGFIARSPRTWRTLCRLAAAAASDAAVWLMGESGTGKELAARALHEVSKRSAGPMVTLSCAALPEALAEAELFGALRGAFTGSDRDRDGAFVRADGGTLFLDEVGELSLGVQAKLLRALSSGEIQPLGASEPRRVHVRVVAATWRDLEVEVQAGRFRFDLLQRLGVLRLALAPLRERSEDVGPLLEASLEGLGAQDLWPDDALLRELEAASWPGNVRQLQSVAQRTAVWGAVSELRPRPRRPPHRQAPDSGQPSHSRRAHLQAALRSAGGNRAAAARDLGVSRSTLYRWLTPTC